MDKPEHPSVIASSFHADSPVLGLIIVHLCADEAGVFVSVEGAAHDCADVPADLL